MTLEEALFVRRAAHIVLVLVGARLMLAAVMPLAADEAYYWLWSKNLAAGYYDHPPAIAWLIRLGALLAGDRALGVRLVPVLLALPMTWAVYRSADLLFADRRLAARAAVFLNLTLLVAAGTVIVTPDAPLLVASAFVLYGLAQVCATGRGGWWLAVGAAAGAALLSKYSALFFGAGIVLWLALVPDQRRWFMTPWPYVGGLVALLLFSPVIVWNAEHGWVSFIKQFGRARGSDFSLRYFAELVPVQIGLATPSIFLLGCVGLWALWQGRGGTRATRVLLGSMIWPILLYFAWHSLHDRVEGNWLAPVYPAFAIVAALAADGVSWRGPMQTLVDLSRRCAAPVGIAMFAVVALQATLGIIPLRRDPTARLLAVGWPELAQHIEALRAQTDAGCVVATNYGITAWLAFYLPPGTCVVQIAERIRWVNTLEPDRALLAGRVLYVGDVDAELNWLRTRYESVESKGQLSRARNGIVIDTYRVDLLAGLKGDPFDRTPPAELR